MNNFIEDFKEFCVINDINIEISKSNGETTPLFTVLQEMSRYFTNTQISNKKDVIERLIENCYATNIMLHPRGVCDIYFAPVLRHLY
jgi:hypothetical protein